MDPYGPDDILTADKKHCHDLLVILAKSVNSTTSSPRRALTLEAANAWSAKALCERAGFKWHEIDAPNPRLYGGLNHDELAKKLFVHANWIDMPFGSFLRLAVRRNQQYDVIWADFCGTWTGRKDGFRPHEDIKYMFEAKLLKENAVFAITLSCRNSRKDTLEVSHDLHKFAADNKYLLTPAGLHQYGQMSFQLFSVSSVVFNLPASSSSEGRKKRSVRSQSRKKRSIRSFRIKDLMRTILRFINRRRLWPYSDDKLFVMILCDCEVRSIISKINCPGQSHGISSSRILTIIHACLSVALKSDDFVQKPRDARQIFLDAGYLFR